MHACRRRSAQGNIANLGARKRLVCGSGKVLGGGGEAGRARCGECDMDADAYSNGDSKTTGVIHVITVSIYEYE